MIVGIDEVGRGCWAGPVVAGAVVLRRALPGLKDSKKLTKLQREALDIRIRKRALAIGLGWASSQEVDELGLTEAVRLAMRRALNEITISFDRVIIDGNYNYLADIAGTETLIKADDLIPSVSAASIVAKVARDKWMATEAAQRFPHYEFERHVGYGTRLHAAHIKTHGICEIHRVSYAPVRLAIQPVV